MRIIMKKGTKLICPSCKAEIATAVRDLKSQERMMVNQFIFNSGHETNIYEQTICKKCGASYADHTTGSIHTEHGWT